MLELNLLVVIPGKVSRLCMYICVMDVDAMYLDV